MEIAVGMHQHQGKREYQQDAMSIKQFGSIGVLAILADGMGGYEGGEIASKLISENFREFIIEGDDINGALKKYLLKGNESIQKYKVDHLNVKNMGTTAIGFFMTDKAYHWVSVGDSPLYSIKNRKIISRINENHSVAGLLDLQVIRGEISEEEALSNGQRHMLTSAVSGESIPQIDLSGPRTIKEDEIFILASDGIETISDDRIKEITLAYMPVITQENAKKASEALVREVIAKNTPNQDNVTVIILAKIEDNEPQTILYTPAKDKKKLLTMIIAVLSLSMVVIVLWMFMDKDKPKPRADVNETVTRTSSDSRKIPIGEKIKTEGNKNSEANKSIPNNKVGKANNLENSIKADLAPVKEMEKAKKRDEKQADEDEAV